MIEGFPNWFTIPVMALGVIGGWALIYSMFRRRIDGEDDPKDPAAGLKRGATSGGDNSTDCQKR